MLKGKISKVMSTKSHRKKFNPTYHNTIFRASTVLWWNKEWIAVTVSRALYPFIWIKKKLECTDECLKKGIFVFFFFGPFLLETQIA